MLRSNKILFDPILSYRSVLVRYRASDILRQISRDAQLSRHHGRCVHIGACHCYQI